MSVSEAFVAMQGGKEITIDGVIMIQKLESSSEATIVFKTKPVRLSKAKMNDASQVSSHFKNLG